MFRIDQIMSATRFIRSFKEVARRLSENHEPLLITQRNGRFMVIMDGVFFEAIMDARRHLEATIGDPDDSFQDVFEPNEHRAVSERKTAGKTAGKTRRRKSDCSL